MLLLPVRSRQLAGDGNLQTPRGAVQEGLEREAEAAAYQEGASAEAEEEQV